MSVAHGPEIALPCSDVCSVYNARNPVPSQQTDVMPKCTFLMRTPPRGLNFFILSGMIYGSKRYVN